MTADSPANFYDSLAPDYRRVYADWRAATDRQAAALDAIVRERLGAASKLLLDCSCGIGTQAVGLAARGYGVVGSDLSRAAVALARREAAARELRLPTAAADMRRLPYADSAFDVVLSADNSVPHLTTEDELLCALSQLRRVLVEGGLLLLTVRDYDAALADRPRSTPPQISADDGRRTVTFQLWNWHEDGRRYDLEHFQLHESAQGWRTETRSVGYWALTRAELSGYVARSGFSSATWHFPQESGFFQPVLSALAS